IVSASIILRHGQLENSAHPRESGDLRLLSFVADLETEIPAFSGMTRVHVARALPSCPAMRRNRRAKMRVLTFLAMVLLAFSVPARAEPVESFPSFVANFESVAVAGGVARDFYRRATRGMTPDTSVPNLVASQPEFTTP